MNNQILKLENGDFEVLAEPFGVPEQEADSQRIKQLELTVAVLQREIASIKRDKWGE